tara:strand:+ start:510 stop:749 length:240 start_codon:yes stop_codon:yes gene_type:complete
MCSPLKILLTKVKPVSNKNGICITRIVAKDHKLFCQPIIPIAEDKKPIVIDPESPKKIFALLKFQNKKPRREILIVVEI